MSTSSLAFLTLLEKRVHPLLPVGKTWRFQRIVDFRAHEATLQLWDEPGGAQPGILIGQVAMRETRREDGTTSFGGLLQGAAGKGDPQKFSFHPQTHADVEHEAQLIAETWGRLLSPVD